MNRPASASPAAHDRPASGLFAPGPLVLIGMIVIAALTRLLPHPPNFSPVEAVAPRLQRQPAFPESVNVGFAQVQTRQRLRLRVYERGVGETLACGSGACAAAAVLMRRGRVDRDVTVALPGGDLRIVWPADDAPLSMSGPTAFVFEGEWIA